MDYMLPSLARVDVLSLLRREAVGVRWLSAIPNQADAIPAGEAFSPADGSCFLVRLRERTWNPTTNLPETTVKQITGAAPERVGIVRDAFAVHDQNERPLSQLMRCLQPQRVAVHPDLARPHTRAVVDHYERTSAGTYALKQAAIDLLSWLPMHGVRMQLAENLAAAKLRNAKQSTNEVLMVAPTAFGFNEQTAADNYFMHAAAKPGEGSELTKTVAAEFAQLHHQLTEVHGVRVSLMQHNLAHNTPDACFPNNWFSTHPRGEAAGGTAQSTLVLYPMKCPNRAAERRPELVDFLNARGYARVVDLSAAERTDHKYFEGTGVLVVDRVNGIAYVALSERADRSLAERWVRALGYKQLVAFHSTDSRAHPVYHTNVMMAIGTSVAIVCGESITDDTERRHLFDTLGRTHEIVDITCSQMDQLCGNALELEDRRGLPIMAMSTQAYKAFLPQQRATILRHCADIVHAPIDTLERVGGGGVRCTLGELF